MTDIGAPKIPMQFMMFLYMTPTLESDVQQVHQKSYDLCFSNKPIQPQCSINSNTIIQKIK
jgi:hypothetical protein